MTVEWQFEYFPKKANFILAKQILPLLLRSTNAMKIMPQKLKNENDFYSGRI